MSTPVINAIDNVNDAALNNLFQAVANNATATDNLLGSNRNIDAVGSNAQAARGLGNNGGDDDVIRRALCRRTGRTPANFPNTATDIIQDGTFRGEILGDASLSGLISGSQPGMAEIASSATLTNEVIASQAALQAVAASQTAMQEVASSQTAMQEVAASQTAMQEVVSSQTAMQKVAASQTAMQEVAASQTAMQEVANSQAAINEIGSVANESVTTNTVLNSGTAESELVNSSLVQRFSDGFSNAGNAADTITNSRVLVTSNNDVGDVGVGINFSISAGPRTNPGTTFIVNGANSTNVSSNTGGSVGFDGIQIN